jgi:hypothetical protein
MVKIIPYILFYMGVFSAPQVLAQVGGRNSFEFLRIPPDARTAGLGGVNISAAQGDVNRFVANPALLNDSLANKAAFSYNPWQADIAYFNVAYTHRFKKIGLVGFQAQAIPYGQMPITDASGAVNGTFKANDFAIGITKTFRQDYFTYGATLKLLGSQVETYNAYGLALDIGGTFRHPKHDLTVGIAFKNLGFAVNNYAVARTYLPFDIQLGASYKPEYMPFRFSLTLHHLHQFDIVYLDPTQSTQLDANGNPVAENKTLGDKLLRHFVLGSELILAKGFQVLLGYNHLINREMRVQNLTGLRGFSFGFRLSAKVWSFSYAHGTYYVGAGRNFLTLSGDLSKILRKKKK